MTAENAAMAAQIKEKLLASKRVLLHCHPNPDEDSVGSALAMKYMLESLGVAADIARGDSELPAHLSILPGHSSILDNTVHECDLSAYDIFMALDSSNPAYVTQKKDFSFPSHITVIVIDHHKSNSGYGVLNLIAPEYPATGQILYDLAGLWGVTLTHDMALNLFERHVVRKRYPPEPCKVIEYLSCSRVFWSNEIENAIAAVALVVINDNNGNVRRKGEIFFLRYVGGIGAV